MTRVFLSHPIRWVCANYYLLTFLQVSYNKTIQPPTTLQHLRPHPKVFHQIKLILKNFEILRAHGSTSLSKVPPSNGSTSQHLQEKGLSYHHRFDVFFWFTLPETNSFPLKIGQPKRNSIFQLPTIFFSGATVC